MRHLIHKQTIYSNSCTVFTNASSAICVNCTRLKGKIDLHLNKFKENEPTLLVSSSKPVSSMTTSEIQQKTRQLSTEKNNQQKQISKLRAKIATLENGFLEQGVKMSQQYEKLIHTIRSKPKELNAAFAKHSQQATILNDQIYNLICKFLGPNGSKGKVWSKESKALFNFIPRLSRLSTLNLLEVPSRVTLQNALKDYRFGDKKVELPRLKTTLLEKRSEHAKRVKNAPKHPWWIFLVDEMSLDRSVTFNPNDQAVKGLPTNFGEIDTTDTKNMLKGNTSTELATEVTQVTFLDLTTAFRYSGPFILTKSHATVEELHNFLYHDLLLFFAQGKNSVIFHAILSDAGPSNEAIFKKWLKRSQLYINSENLPDDQFYTLCFRHPGAPEHRVYLAFDPPHTFKNFRNEFWGSQTSHPETSSKILQLNGKNIVWDHIITMFNEKGEDHCRKLTKKNVYLNSFTKMRVSHALSVFCDSTLSGLNNKARGDSLFEQEARSTIQFVQAVYDIFVGTLVNPKSGDGDYLKVAIQEPNGVDHPIKVGDITHPFFIRIEKGLKFFDDWKELSETDEENNTFIHQFKYFAIKAYVATFKAILKEFTDFQKQRNNIDKAYINPFLLNTNFMERTFSFIRMLGGDHNATYSTALAKWRLHQELVLHAKFQNKLSSRNKKHRTIFIHKHRSQTN